MLHSFDRVADALKEYSKSAGYNHTTNEEYDMYTSSSEHEFNELNKIENKAIRLSTVLYDEGDGVVDIRNQTLGIATKLATDLGLDQHQLDQLHNGYTATISDVIKDKQITFFDNTIYLTDRVMHVAGKIQLVDKGKRLRFIVFRFKETNTYSLKRTKDGLGVRYHTKLKCKPQVQYLSPYGLDLFKHFLWTFRFPVSIRDDIFHSYVRVAGINHRNVRIAVGEMDMERVVDDEEPLVTMAALRHHDFSWKRDKSLSKICNKYIYGGILNGHTCRNLKSLFIAFNMENSLYQVMNRWYDRLHAYNGAVDLTHIVTAYFIDRMKLDGGIDDEFKVDENAAIYRRDLVNDYIQACQMSRVYCNLRLRSFKRMYDLHIEYANRMTIERYNITAINRHLYIPKLIDLGWELIDDPLRLAQEGKTQ